MLTIEPGRPEDADTVSRMIAETDRELFTYCGGGHLGVWVEVAGWEWRECRGVYCHEMASVARLDGEIVGLLIAYSARRHGAIDWSFGSSRARMPAERWAPVGATYPLAAFLFPAIPDDAYYVQNIVTSPSVRGLKVGSRLMKLAFEQGRAEGCRSCHLDVDGSTPAVGFYEHLGLRVLVKTEVPGLPGVSTHYRMVRDLGAPVRA